MLSFAHLTSRRLRAMIPSQAVLVGRRRALLDGSPEAVQTLRSARLTLNDMEESLREVVRREQADSEFLAMLICVE